MWKASRAGIREGQIPRISRRVGWSIVYQGRNEHRLLVIRPVLVLSRNSNPTVGKRLRAHVSSACSEDRGRWPACYSPSRIALAGPPINRPATALQRPHVTLHDAHHRAKGVLRLRSAVRTATRLPALDRFRGVTWRHEKVVFHATGGAERGGLEREGDMAPWKKSAMSSSVSRAGTHHRAAYPHDGQDPDTESPQLKRGHMQSWARSAPATARVGGAVGVQRG